MRRVRMNGERILPGGERPFPLHRRTTVVGGQDILFALEAEYESGGFRETRLDTGVEVHLQLLAGLIPENDFSGTGTPSAPTPVMRV